MNQRDQCPKLRSTLNRETGLQKEKTFHFERYAEGMDMKAGNKHLKQKIFYGIGDAGQQLERLGSIKVSFVNKVRG